MQRYFVHQNQIEGSRITLSGEDARHISRVMRMEPGAEILCCDEQGRTALCRITEITNEAVASDIIQWTEESAELPVKVAIASGLPKGDKLELVIQKGTELGARRFIPFIAGRSIVKWDGKKGSKKVERWQKIAKEAAEQSHRSFIPEIDSPLSFKELEKASEAFDYKIIAYEEEAKRGEKSAVHDVLSQLQPGQSLLAVFGPEGGLSEKEVAALQEIGFRPCSLGPRILRTETAPLYLLSAVSYHFELAR